MSATPDDEQSLEILKAIGRRCRPYTDRDIARATRLSQRVVQRRLRRLEDAGLVRCLRRGEWHEHWELASEPPPSRRGGDRKLCDE